MFAARICFRRRVAGGGVSGGVDVRVGGGGGSGGGGGGGGGSGWWSPSTNYARRAMPENPTGLPAVFNGKSAGSAADDASGAAETPAAAPVAAAGVALSGDARRDAESNDATCCGPNDSINTVAARSCSPHSTTPPQAASTSHKKLLLQRADAAQLRQAAAAVEEQRQQDQPAEAEDQSNVSSALQLQRCLAAVVKLSAAVSGAEGGERVLACIANLLVSRPVCQLSSTSHPHQQVPLWASDKIPFRTSTSTLIRLPLYPHRVAIPPTP